MDTDTSSTVYSADDIIKALVSQLETTRRHNTTLRANTEKKRNLLNIGRCILSDHCRHSFTCTYQNDIEARIETPTAVADGWLLTVTFNSSDVRARHVDEIHIIAIHPSIDTKLYTAYKTVDASTPRNEAGAVPTLVLPFIPLSAHIQFNTSAACDHYWPNLDIYAFIVQNHQNLACKNANCCSLTYVGGLDVSASAWLDSLQEQRHRNTKVDCAFIDDMTRLHQVSLSWLLREKCTEGHDNGHNKKDVAAQPLSLLKSNLESIFIDVFGCTPSTYCPKLPVQSGMKSDDTNFRCFFFYGGAPGGSTRGGDEQEAVACITIETVVDDDSNQPHSILLTIHAQSHYVIRAIQTKVQGILTEASFGDGQKRVSTTIIAWTPTTGSFPSSSRHLGIGPTRSQGAFDQCIESMLEEVDMVQTWIRGVLKGKKDEEEGDAVRSPPAASGRAETVKINDIIDCMIQTDMSLRNNTLIHRSL